MYETAAPTDLASFRNRHAEYKTGPDLQAAHAAHPWVVTWDDHEVENDYAGTHSWYSQSDFLQRRDAAYQAYYEHMSLRPSWTLAGQQGV
ncbi:MAG TPA: alkaline phosphatase D family protein [Rubrobacteraceae bacterium]|jgi:alkaline phosphatase D|nr:alkaline phosphatase D family protein [Rubrobacteraceae bacterium]